MISSTRHFYKILIKLNYNDIYYFQIISKKPNENGHENQSNSSGNTSANGSDQKVTNAGQVLETSTTSANTSAVSCSSSSSVSDLKSVSVTMTSTPVSGVSGSNPNSSNNSAAAADLSTKPHKSSSAYDFNASDSFGPNDKSIPPMRKDSPAKVR